MTLSVKSEQGMKEDEIRPKELFERYLTLSRQDAQAMQERAEEFVKVACPACAATDAERLFTKNSFSIRRCLGCASIYCSPRPSVHQLEQYYIHSPSSHFWAKEFFPVVAKARQAKLFAPKAAAIYELLKENHFAPQSICDVGAGYGSLLDELKGHWPAARFMAIEPGQEFARVCREKGYDVLETTVEQSQEWQQVADLVVCFEVIEHVFDPQNFVASIVNLVKPGGYCLVTGLCGDGFDIQVLGEHSRSIWPPHHLNFLSVAGLQQLFLKSGFANVTVSTPGKLDVDIVRNAQDSGVSIPGFVQTLLQRGEAAQAEFQEFLVRNNLSSHVWILAQR